MKILAIDTTAAAVSAALMEDDCLVGEYYLNRKTTHSQTLMPMLSALLNASQTDLPQIDVFAVNVGPGSFTGVRIGVSTVKGLSLPLQKPCAPVSTLLAMAYGLPAVEGLVCAVMDARCGQVYNALFRRTPEGPQRLTDDRALSLTELEEELSEESGPVYLVGDGAALAFEKMASLLPRLRLLPPSLRFQHASGTALAALDMVRSNQLCSSDALQPAYLRLPQAERERLARLRKNPE